MAPWKATTMSTSLGQRRRHPVARSDAEIGEGVRGAVGEPVELGVGQAAGAGDQHLPVGIGGEAAIEDPGDGLGPAGHPSVCAAMTARRSSSSSMSNDRIIQPSVS